MILSEHPLDTKLTACQSGGMVRIGSYNIQKAIGIDARRKPERTLKVMAELDCDVLALQEADKRFGPREATLDPDMIVRWTDYKVIPLSSRSHSLGWHGNAILVRKSVKVLSHQRIDLPALEPRGAVMADLQVGDVVLRVAAMHLSLIGHFRKRQISSLVNQLHGQNDHTNDLPTVLVGDLNEWRNRADCLKLFSPHFEVISPGRSFPSPLPVACLDRLITSREWIVKRSGVHGSTTARIASDHLPIWAELSLNEEFPATLPKTAA